MSIETVRLTEQNKDQLIRIKRKTKIQNWNVLCRWALCLSLSDPTPPPEVHFENWSNVEMTWKVFGGGYSELYLDCLICWCNKAGLSLSDDNLQYQLRLHISRGINILINKELSYLLAIY